MSDKLNSLDLLALRSADSLPIMGTTIDLLDLNKVADHIRRASESGRYQGPSSPIEYLLHKQCLIAGDEPQVTLAGLLCFGRATQQLFPKAVIDLGHYRGIEPLSFEVVHLEKDIGGTIFDQLARVESYVWSNIHHGMTLADRGFQRVETHEYPRAVIRELCVNMIAHRDYTNFRSAARVQIFRNRIEWISPGGLPPNVTVENILEEQAARNPAVLSILYEAGFVEAFGQGLNTVVAVLTQEAMTPPHFHDTGASFIVTVHGRPLDIFYGGGIYGQLNESQRKILSLLRTRGDLTPREIANFSAGRAKRSIQRDISGLVQRNLVLQLGEGRALHYRIYNSLATDPLDE
jgi:predicted HTH transcriptional regulator